MSLRPPEKVQKLQQALHAKAKGSPDYRFYALYDKVWRVDVLAFAYDCCRGNRGEAGVDGQTFDDIEAYGRERWLGELAQELRTKQYRPQPVRRVWIPKPDGQQRPLGIPTIRDRVVQTAALAVLGPIFEADLPPEQYAYRPNRGALEAVQAVLRLVQSGHVQVVDADLSGYFDSVPHRELMRSVARRVSDRHVLHLIKMWLKSPVHNDERSGESKRGAGAARGTPQGAPISPLLSNLYMRRFVLGWKKRGHEERLGARIVNYADDFVICCRGSAAAAMQAMRDLMAALKLTVNEAKTRVCRVPEESFDFLGYTIGLCFSGRTRRMYVGTRPSRRSIDRVRQSIHQKTRRCLIERPTEAVVADLNRQLTGWSNYFCLGSVSGAYRIVDEYVRDRLRWWLSRKHKCPRRDYRRFNNKHLQQVLGLMALVPRTQTFPWAKA